MYSPRPLFTCRLVRYCSASRVSPRRPISTPCSSPIILTRTLPSSSVLTATDTCTPISWVSSCRKVCARPAAVSGAACSAGSTGFLGSWGCCGRGFFSAGLRAGFLGASGCSAFGASSCAGFSAAFLGAAGFFSTGLGWAGFSCAGLAGASACGLRAGCFLGAGFFSSRESANSEWVSSTLLCSITVRRTRQGRLPNRPNRPLLPSSTTSTFTSPIVRPRASRPASIASSRVLPVAS